MTSGYRLTLTNSEFRSLRAIGNAFGYEPCRTIYLEMEPADDAARAMCEDPEGAEVGAFTLAESAAWNAWQGFEDEQGAEASIVPLAPLSLAAKLWALREEMV